MLALPYVAIQVLMCGLRAGPQKVIPELPDHGINRPP